MIEEGYRINRQIQSETLPTSEQFNKELEAAGIPVGPSKSSIVNEQAVALYGGLAQQQVSNATGLSKGVAKTGQDIANTIPDTANAVLSGLKSLDEWALSKGITKEHLINPNTSNFQRFDFAPKPNPEEKLSYSLGAMASQLLTFGATTLSTGSKVAGIAAGGATMYATQDPSAPHLADFVKDTPIVGPMTEFLQTKPDDSEAMSRFKASLEAMGIDAALIPIVEKAAGWYRTWKNGAQVAEDAAQTAKIPAPEVGPGTPKTFAEAQPPKEMTPPTEAVKPVIENPQPNVFSGMSATQVDEAIQSGLRSASNEQKAGVNFQPYIRGESPVTGLAGAAENLAKTPGQIGVPMPKTDPAVFEQAAAIVGDTNKMTELLNKPVNSPYTDIEIAALNMEMTAAGNEAKKYIDEIQKIEVAGQTPSDQQLVLMDQALGYFSNVFGKFNNAASASGSALRMVNYSFDSKGQAKALGEYLSMIGGSQSVRDRAAMAAELINKDPNGLMKIGQLQADTGATVGQALYEVYVQNMISPVTAVKVGFSNMAQQLTGTLSRQMAAKIALKEGQVDIANAISFAASEQQKALYQSIGSEVISGVKTFLENINDIGMRAFLPSQITRGMRYDYRAIPAMSGKALNVQNRIGSAFIDAVGESSKFGTIPLQLVDKYSDAIAIKTEGAFRANLAGIEKGLSGEELYSYVQDVLKERPVRPVFPAKASPAEARAFAEQMDKYQEYSKIWSQIDSYRDSVKFQQTPTTGIGGKFYDMVVSSDNRILGVPFLRAISPFVRNKVNMAQAALDALPGIRGLSSRNQEILAKGGVDAYLLKANMRIMNNVMLAGAAGGLAGLTYGLGSLNPAVREKQQERGYNPYSFMNTANFDSAGTPGIVGAIATDVGFLAKYYMSGAVDEKWNTDFTDAIAYITASLADKLTIDDTVIDLWHGMAHLDQNPKAAVGGQIIKGINTLALPSAATFNAARKLIDPTKRQTKSDALGVIQNVIMDLANRIPGVNKSLEPALDTLGYPITEKFGAIRLVTEFDPEFLQKNKILKGLTDLGMAGALVTPHPEGASKDTLAIHPMGKSLMLRGTSEAIALTPAQYNDLVLMSLGKESPNKPGKVERMIGDILSSNKSDALKKLQILKIVDSNRAVAKVQLVKKYPELMDKWRELVKNRANAYREGGLNYLPEGVSTSDTQGPLGADFLGD